MVDTIRDVVVRVAVEAGQYNSSSFKAIANDIRTQLRGAVGDLYLGSASQISPQSNATAAAGGGMNSTPGSQPQNSYVPPRLQQLQQDYRNSQITSSVGALAGGTSRLIGAGTSLYAASGGHDAERMSKIMMAGQGLAGVYGGASALTAGAIGLAGLGGTGAAAALGVAVPVLAATGAASAGWEYLKANESTNRLYRKYDHLNQERVAQSRSMTNIASLRANLDYAKATGINPLGIKRDAFQTRVEMAEQREHGEYEGTAFQGFENRVQTLGQHEGEMARARQNLDFGHSQKRFENSLQDLNERKELLIEGQKKLEAEPDRIHAQAEKDRGMIDLQINQIKSDPDWGYDKKTGEPRYSSEQGQKMASLGEQRQQVSVNEQQALVKNSEDVLKNKEKQVQVEQNIVEVLAQQNKSIEQYKSEALDVLKTAQARTKQHRMSLGSSSIGEMWYRKELDEKHKRNEAKKAENKAQGKDEMEGLEEWTQEEIQFLGNTEDAARKGAEEQALRQGNALGIGGYYDNDTKKAQEEYDNRVNDTKGKSDKIAEQGKDAENGAIKTSTEARKSLEAVEHMRETLETVLEVMSKMHEVADEMRARSKEFT